MSMAHARLLKTIAARVFVLCGQRGFVDADLAALCNVASISTKDNRQKRKSTTAPYRRPLIELIAASLVSWVAPIASPPRQAGLRN